MRTMRMEFLKRTEATFEKGCDALLGRNLKEAVDYFLAAEEEGSTDASYALGYMYLESIYFDFYAKKAEEYLLKAANKGNVLAQRTLGCVYMGMFNTMELNIDKAEMWFRKAMEQKDCCSLACSFLFGVCNRPYSPYHAWQIIKKSQPKNFVDYLQTHYYYAEILSRKRGDGVSFYLKPLLSMGLASARLLYHRDDYSNIWDGGIDKLAQKKNPEAIFRLAESEGWPQRAIVHYQEAAELGHREAISKMGTFWERLSKKLKDLPEPLKNLNAAAE